MEIKRKYPYSLVILFFLFSCVPEQDNENKIKEFYSSYLIAADNLDFVTLDSIRKKYLTKSLINRMNEMDYDGVLNSNDIDTRWVDNILVKKDSLNDNTYYVSFTNGSFYLELKMINDNGKYKIHDINELPENHHFKKIYTNSIGKNGIWQIYCKGEAGSLNIENDNAFIEVNSNQIYIDALIENSNDTLFNIYLVKPNDLGSGGMMLNWDHFSKDSIIARFKYNSKSGLIAFNWKGFYDMSIKERVWADNSDFQLVAEKLNNINLVKCD